MRILIAEDDLASRTVLEKTLKHWGHEVVVTCNGQQAWQEMQEKDSPQLAILDWMMPEMDGTEICRRLRSQDVTKTAYIILLTAREQKEDVVTGLESGADDYVVKPFNRAELHSRIRVGERILGLQQSLANRVHELEAALAQVKQLSGLLPICCYCKKIRDDLNYWHQVEAYLASHSEVSFSHGICPECFQTKVAPELERLKTDEVIHDERSRE